MCSVIVRRSDPLIYITQTKYMMVIKQIKVGKRNRIIYRCRIRTLMYFTFLDRRTWWGSISWLNGLVVVLVLAILVLFYIRIHVILLGIIKQVTIKCNFAFMQLTEHLSFLYYHLHELHKIVNCRGSQYCVGIRINFVHKNVLDVLQSQFFFFFTD